MLEREKPAVGWMLSAVAAVGSWWLMDQYDAIATRAALGVLALIFTFGAVWLGANELSAKAVGWYIQIIAARARTPSVLMMETIARMTPEQLEVAKLGAAEIIVQGGDPGPLYYLRTFDNGEDIAVEWIENTFLARSTNVYLCPIHTWNDGSRDRDWARRFTSLMVKNNFAEPAAGNTPAKWIDQKHALAWLGIGG